MKIETPPLLKGRTLQWDKLHRWLSMLQNKMQGIKVNGYQLTIEPPPYLETISDEKEWNVLSNWLASLHGQISQPFSNNYFTSTKTTTATLTIEEKGIVFVDSSAAGFTITLPQSAKIGVGGWYLFIKTDSSTNAVTLDGAGAETINGAATDARLTAQYDYMKIVTDGSNWFIGGIKNML